MKSTLREVAHAIHMPSPEIEENREENYQNGMWRWRHSYYYIHMNQTSWEVDFPADLNMEDRKFRSK